MRLQQGTKASGSAALLGNPHFQNLMNLMFRIGAVVSVQDRCRIVCSGQVQLGWSKVEKELLFFNNAGVNKNEDS